MAVAEEPVTFRDEAGQAGKAQKKALKKRSGSRTSRRLGKVTRILLVGAKVGTTTRSPGWN